MLALDCYFSRLSMVLAWGCIQPEAEKIKNFEHASAGDSPSTAEVGDEQTERHFHFVDESGINGIQESLTLHNKAQIHKRLWRPNSPLWIPTSKS